MKKRVNLQTRERRVVENHDALIRETAGTLQAGPERDLRLVGKPTGKFDKEGRQMFDDVEIEIPPRDLTRAEQLAELCEAHGGTYKIKGGSNPNQPTRIEFTFGAETDGPPADGSGDSVEDFDDDPNNAANDEIEGDKIVGRGYSHQEAIDDLRARLDAYKAALGDDTPAENEGKAKSRARKSGGAK